MQNLILYRKSLTFFYTLFDILLLFSACFFFLYFSILLLYFLFIVMNVWQMNETYQHPGKWHDTILIPQLTRSSGNHFIMSHVIHGLEPNSVYEAIVQAKNRYGWNEVRCHSVYTIYQLLTIRSVSSSRISHNITYSIILYSIEAAMGCLFSSIMYNINISECWRREARV